MRVSTTVITETESSSHQVRALLRDTASILRIRYHQDGSGEAAAGAARAEFFAFMSDALALLDGRAVILGPDDPKPDRRVRPARSWLINPLDGLGAFRAGFPCFSVVLGAARGPRIVAGYVYNPVTEDLFWSDESHGCAYYRDQEIGVSRSANGAFGFRERDGVKCSAALTLCSVAAGRCDYAAVGACDWITGEVARYIVEKAGGKTFVSRRLGTVATASRSVRRTIIRKGVSCVW